MKLYLNEASPYARLVRVLLVETGLDAETQLIFVDPWQSPNELLAANPASKVPALTLDDGTRLVESSCIGDYLIMRAGRSALSPLSPLSHADAEKRLQILGLGRAAIDCSFGGVVQRRHAPGSPLIDRWLAALPRISRALDKLYSEAASTDVDLADLTVAVAFEYVDFRLPEVQWRNEAPDLAARIATLGRRLSLATTRPR